MLALAFIPTPYLYDAAWRETKDQDSVITGRLYGLPLQLTNSRTEYRSARYNAWILR